MCGCVCMVVVEGSRLRLLGGGGAIVSCTAVRALLVVCVRPCPGPISALPLPEGCPAAAAARPRLGAQKAAQPRGRSSRTGAARLHGAAAHTARAPSPRAFVLLVLFHTDFS